VLLARPACKQPAIQRFSRGGRGEDVRSAFSASPRANMLADTLTALGIRHLGVGRFHDQFRVGGDRARVAMLFRGGYRKLQ